MISGYFFKGVFPKFSRFYDGFEDAMILVKFLMSLLGFFFWGYAAGEHIQEGPFLPYVMAQA